uniref:Transposase (Putative), gypsy type n=1 Tax=Tanacetum cinerariifolium TaxID=118510 RepID=A0A699GJU4_TANCI|nr:transposase (putative), gypsy type [Tanacetum cinerariifolium]
MDVKCVISQKAFDGYCEKFHIPEEVHLVLLNRGDTIHERHVGKIGLYTRFFDFANFRLPLSTYLVDILRDPFPVEADFNARDYATLFAHPSSFHKFLEEFLYLVRTSRHYTLDEETYPRLLHKNREEMDLFAFIHTLDPTKVKIVEWERVKDEPLLLQTIVRRTVPLLLVAPDRADSELETSIDMLFDEGGSDVAPLHPRRQRKKKTIVVDAGGSSRPPKKLREDHGTPSGPSVAGKSRSAVHRLNLLTISAPQRFVISSDSSYHSGANVAVGEVDSLVRAARQMSLSAKVRMRAECNIKEKWRLKFVVKEKEELLKAKDKEIKNLKAQMVRKETKAAEAIRLHVEASNFVNVEKSLRDEVNAVNEHNTVLKKERDALDVKVVDLEASGVIKEREMTDLNGPSFRGAIGKAIEKGMQDGLSAGITHGAKGRVLTDVAAYNPSTKADYIYALQHLQNVNFPLLAELRSNKDASVDTLKNILRLEETLAERLGLTESQPHVDQLMVPIHHSPDQVVVGASSLSLALDVSSSRVWKIKENIANYRSALRDVFVPLAEPLSATALTGTVDTSNVIFATADTTTALAFVTSYGPSHLGPSFPVSSARLASLLRYTRSTFAVMSVGMLISAKITATFSYVNENEVS